MKIYISLDAAGCGDLVHPEELRPGAARCAAAMLDDLAAVVGVAVENGANYLVICDASAGGINLPGEDVLARAGVDEAKRREVALKLIRGVNAPDGMMQGVSPFYDTAFFVGYHARRGARGVLAHTFFPGVVLGAYVEILKNGNAEYTAVGEFGLNACLAGAHGVAAALVSGDDVVCQEAAQLTGGRINCAVVKYADANTAALCEGAEIARSVLRAHTLFAVGGVVPGVKGAATQSVAPLIAAPYIDIEFFTADQAVFAQNIAGAQDAGENKVRFAAETYAAAYRAALAGMRLATLAGA